MTKGIIIIKDRKNIIIRDDGVDVWAFGDVRIIISISLYSYIIITPIGLLLKQEWYYMKIKGKIHIIKE